MADFPGVDTVINEGLVPLLKTLLRPIFCFQSIVQGFEGQRDKLTSVKDEVKAKIARGKNDANVISKNVQEWLGKVDGAMKEVGTVEIELKKNKSCFPCSWCPNWTYHYNFSKQVMELTATMTKLREHGSSFGEVGYPPILRQDFTGLPSYAAFIHTPSSRSAFDRIVAALGKNDVNCIGIYGKTGTGKTGLAEQVAHEAQDIFNHVILVHLCQYPRVRDIQGVIADRLNLSLQGQESEEGRASKLQKRLEIGEKILIIFDDMRKNFNLGAVVGILLPGGCKIILTAHDQTHVPNSMHTQMHVELEALSENEAWTLFERVAGVGDEVRTHDVAKKALAECYGLPKAVVATGRAINGKCDSEWGETLQQVKTDRLHFIDSLTKAEEKLRARRQRVNNGIQMAKVNSEEIYTDVGKWLEEVDSALEEVQQFREKFEERIWCFDKGDHYVTTRQADLTTNVDKLYDQGNYTDVSHPAPLIQQGIGFCTSAVLTWLNAANVIGRVLSS